MSILLAGGGTAGHVNPLLAVADVLRERHPDLPIIVLGTAEGLESTLVPARGYELTVIPKLPFPRRPNPAAVTFGPRFAKTVRSIRSLIRDRSVTAVAGFGGYAAAPAYLAAGRRVPLIIHEANALPGLANRLGARRAARVAVTFPNTPLPRAEVTGMPLRREIVTLDPAAARPAAMADLGLDPARPTLLVTGGSLGAKRLNDAVRETARDVIARGWQILHIVGNLSPFDDPGLPHYRVLTYCSDMNLALAAADLVISRAGASTASELMAVGLPTVFVPYAVGNGEQRHNIASFVDEGAALTLADADFTANRVRADILPLLDDSARRKRLAATARELGVRDGAERVADLILEASASRSASVRGGA